MLTRTAIAAALPPDVLRDADVYCELRLLAAAARATWPTVGGEQWRREIAEGLYAPRGIFAWIQLCDARDRLASELSRFVPHPRPAEWHANWLNDYAGVTAAPTMTVVVGDAWTTDSPRKKARK